MELTKTLKKEEYIACREQLGYIDMQKNGWHTLDQGVQIKLYTTEKPVQLVVRVNPRILTLKDQNYYGIFPPTAQAMHAFIDQFSQFWEDWEIEWKLSDFKLSRVDLEYILFGIPV